MMRSRLITLVLIFTVLSSLVLRPLPVLGLPNYGPGVKPGDEVTYGMLNFTNNTPYQVFPANVTNFKLHINTVNTQTKEVNASLIYNFQNGTQQTQQLFGNTDQGSGNLFPWLVAGNLTAAETLSPIPYLPYIFNETVQRLYAGAIRTVNLLNLTIGSQPGSLQRIVFYWDAQTGVLLDAYSQLTNNSTIPSQGFSVHFQATSTNIWSPSSSPDFTFDATSITTEIIRAGETADFHLVLSSVKGFSGQINITAAPTVPTSQLTMALDQPSVTLTSTTTNASTGLQISTSKTIPIGLYTISVNATSQSITHNDLLLIAVAPPDFIITANPASLTLPEGTSKNSTVTVTGRGGFSGTVSIQLQQFYGGPQINVQLSSPTVTVDATNPTATTILTVDATFSLPETVQIYLTANSGSIYRNLVVSVNVTGPDFRLTSTPSSLTIPQADSAQATIQVTSILDFKGFVDLTTSTYGVIASLSTPVVTLTSGGNANCTLNVSAPIGLSPGQYNVYVSGQDTRGLYRSVYIPVTVTGPDFTITPDRTFATMSDGQTANFALTLSAIDKFNGTITISTTTYRSLLTSTNPSVVTLNTTHTRDTVTVTVTVPPGTPPSQFNQVSIVASNGIVQRYTFIAINIIGPDFSITPNPDLLLLKPGESGISTLTLSSIENFTGTIAFSTSVSGPEISASISPATVLLSGGGTASANLTVTVAPGTLPGYYSVNVQATSGSLTRNVFISVAIVGPDFTISSFPSSLVIQQGQSEKTTVTIQSLDNFTGIISLDTISFYGLLVPPNSTTVNLAKGSTTTVQLQFSAAQNANPGFYNAQIQATSGSISHTVYLSVQIVGPDFSIFPGPQTLTVKQGDSADSTLFLSSINGFAGNITVTATAYGLSVTPSNVTVSLAAGQSANTTITISVPTTSSIGNYYVSIDAYHGTLHHYSTVFVNVIGPDFLLLVPSQLTVQAGSSATTTIQLSSLQGFTGNITLTANVYGANSTGGLVFVKLTPTRVDLSPGGTASAILNVTAAKDTGGTSFQISLEANGISQIHFAYISVTIIGPSFGLNANAQFLTMAPGDTATSTITVSSIDNFTGQVNLTVPSQYGLTATLSRQNVTLAAGSSSTSVLTISVGSGTTPGYYAVVVIGTSGNQTRSLYVTVQVVIPDFIVQSNPYQLTIQVGRSALSTIQLTSQNGYHGNITLTPYFFSGNNTASPLDVTISPSTVHLSAGGLASAIANITATASAVGFNYVSIQATDGNLTHYTFLYVNVIGPTFDLSANPQFLNVLQGATASTTIRISSIDNFTGTVHLSVFSPFGFTATLSQENVTLASGGVADSTLTFSPQTVSGGFYSLTVTGTSDNITRSIFIGVNVTAIGTFTISASPSFLLIPPGGTAQSIVTLHGLGGFTGAITLSTFTVSIDPTSLVSPESITLDSTKTIANATVTITLPNKPTTMFDTIQVYANGNGVLQIADIVVQVKAPDFFVVADPNNIVIQPPGHQTSRISVAALGGFNGTVQLFGQASIQPGVTFNFSPANVTLSPSNIIENSTVTITVARDTAPGTWEADIFGSFAVSGNSTITHFATITLTILPTPDFTISASPGLITVQAGGLGTSSIALSSVNFFNGTVTLFTSGAPLGVSASVFPTSIHLLPFDNLTAALNITTTANVKPGTYTIIITGNSTFGAHATNVTLTVTPPPDFKLSSRAAAMIIARGSQASALLTLSPAPGFNGTVDLTTSSPQGFTASFSVNPLTLSSPSSTLTISVASTVATGNYKLTITGTGGSFTHSVSINITVASSSKISFSITKTLWTHKLSLSKNNNLQTFTATIKNTGQSPAYIQLLAAGNSTSSSLFFNVKTAVTMISPGKTITITLTQQFSSSSIGQKYSLTMQFLYGTSIDQNNNILAPTTTTEAQGSFTVVK